MAGTADALWRFPDMQDLEVTATPWDFPEIPLSPGIPWISSLISPLLHPTSATACGATISADIWKGNEMTRWQGAGCSLGFSLRFCDSILATALSAEKNPGTIGQKSGRWWAASYGWDISCCPISTLWTTGPIRKISLWYCRCTIITQKKKPHMPFPTSMNSEASSLPHPLPPLIFPISMWQKQPYGCPRACTLTSSADGVIRAEERLPCTEASSRSQYWQKLGQSSPWQMKSKMPDAILALCASMYLQEQAAPLPSMKTTMSPPAIRKAFASPPPCALPGGKRQNSS